MSIGFDASYVGVGITGRDFSTGGFNAPFSWFPATDHHELYAVISSDASSSTSTHSYGVVDSNTASLSPFPSNSWSVTGLDFSAHDPGNPETPVVFTITLYSILNDGDSPVQLFQDTGTVLGLKKIPPVYNASVSVSEISGNQRYSFNFDYYGYYQISENSNWTQAEEDNLSVPQTIKYKIIKEVGSTTSTAVDETYDLMGGVNGATTTKYYTESLPSAPEDVIFKIRTYYVSSGAEVFDSSEDVSLSITSLSALPDISITSINYDASSQNINITTDNRVQEVGDISCLFKIYEYNLTHPDASQVEADFSSSYSRIKSLSQTTETDNGDGTFQYAIPYSNLASPNVSAPEYCGYDKKVKVMIDRNSPTKSVTDSNFSNIIDVRLLCPVSLSTLPSIPLSGYSEMEVSKTNVFGQYVVKFAYHRSVNGSGYLSGLSNSAESYRIYREIKQGSSVIYAKSVVASGSIYSLSETDHIADKSWFSHTDTVDVSSLSFDVTSSVDVIYYVEVGVVVGEDSGNKEYWQDSSEAKSRTTPDSLSQLTLISDLSCSRTSETDISLNWTCSTDTFDEVISSGGTVRFDLYEMVTSTALEFDENDDYLFETTKDLEWKHIRSIPVSDSDTNPFSYNYTFPHHKQHYYTNFAILVVVTGGLSYLSQVESDLSLKNSPRIFIKSNDARNFKSIKEKMGTIDMYSRRSLEYDKSVEQTPFSVLRKSARLRNSGVPYKVTR